MILDAELMFSDGQAVTATAVSTNTIDLNSARDIGAGEPMEILVLCTDAVTAAGAATVTFEAISSASENLSSPTVLQASAAIGKADLTAGAEVFRARFQRGNAQRYIGLRYTVDTGPLTAGKFTAALALDRQDRATYPAGYTA